MPPSTDQWLALGSSFLGGDLGDISGSMGRASSALYQLRQAEEKRRLERERLERELTDRRLAQEERERLRQISIEDRDRQQALQLSVEQERDRGEEGYVAKRAAVKAAADLQQQQLATGAHAAETRLSPEETRTRSDEDRALATLGKKTSIDLTQARITQAGRERVPRGAVSPLARFQVEKREQAVELKYLRGQREDLQDRWGNALLLNNVEEAAELKRQMEEIDGVLEQMVSEPPPDAFPPLTSRFGGLADGGGEITSVADLKERALAAVPAHHRALTEAEIDRQVAAGIPLAAILADLEKDLKRSL